MGATGKDDSSVHEGLHDCVNDIRVGMPAENLADQSGIPREEQDEFAAESQLRAERAIEQGVFRDEIVPVEVPDKRGTRLVEVDEHPRAGTTTETLGRLRAAFRRENGTVTAGNASGVNDGAAAIVVMSSRVALERGLHSMGVVESYASVGVEPRIMGIGPVPAVRKLLDQKVVALIGPSLTQTTLAALPLATQAQIPMLSLASSAQVIEPVAERRWGFKMQITDYHVEQARQVYMRKHNQTHVAVIYRNDDEGKTGLAHFKDADKNFGLDESDAEAIAALHDRGFEVAVETNGTRPLPAGVDWVCVSPKADAPLAITHPHSLRAVFGEFRPGPAVHGAGRTQWDEGQVGRIVSGRSGQAGPGGEPSPGPTRGCGVPPGPACPGRTTTTGPGGRSGSWPHRHSRRNRLRPSRGGSGWSSCRSPVWAARHALSSGSAPGSGP